MAGLVPETEPPALILRVSVPVSKPPAWFIDARGVLRRVCHPLLVMVTAGYPRLSASRLSELPNRATACSEVRKPTPYHFLFNTL